METYLHLPIHLHDAVIAHRGSFTYIAFDIVLIRTRRVHLFPWQVYIHSRTDVPNLNAEMTDVIAVKQAPKSQSEVHLVVRETENEDGVREVGADKRNCHFPWEQRTDHYPQYSYSACIVECRRRAEMALCNCTTHLLPRAGNTLSCLTLCSRNQPTNQRAN
jgi:hypothetical protein